MARIALMVREGLQALPAPTGNVQPIDRRRQLQGENSLSPGLCGVLRPAGRAAHFSRSTAPHQKPFHMIKLTVSLSLVIISFPGKEG
jgi:hypothetical protein